MKLLTKFVIYICGNETKILQNLNIIEEKYIKFRKYFIFIIKYL